MPLILLLFIAVPIAELWVIIEVGSAIGVLPTVALLVLTAIAGTALLRSQGGQAWRRFNQALAEGRVPGREIFDGAMIILGGALLLTPGFITDFFGLGFLLPPTRSLARRFVTGLARRRTALGWTVLRTGGRTGPGAPPGGRPPPGPRPRSGYDYEGTAREVPEEETELGRGREDE